PNKIDFLVLTGVGGQGKTRLTRQLMGEMRCNEGWKVGFLAKNRSNAANFSVLADCRLPILLTVDYAETRGTQLDLLLERLSLLRIHDRLRIIMIARNADEERQLVESASWHVSQFARYLRDPSALEPFF
ncbi:MAG: hypothetical protein ACRD2L_03250, partial [Terriglobia bacterium]